MMARSHRQLLARLQKLASVAVQGTLSEVLLRCGTASCGCHRDPARRHGPHLYLKFRNDQGKATALYVPRTHHAEMKKAARAWTEAWETLVALGELNRQALRKRLRRKDDVAAER
jgi:hypothetical protein